MYLVVKVTAWLTVQNKTLLKVWAINNYAATKSNPEHKITLGINGE